jgi:hypothetical protein
VPAALILMLAGSGSQALGQVTNGGFEVGDFDLFSDFNYFPNTFASWLSIPDRTATNVIEQAQGPGIPRTGVSAAKVFGQFNGGPNASLITQSIAAVPGNRYDLSAWAKTASADPIVGIGVAFMSISFRNGGGTLLELTTYDVLDETSVQDLYTQTAFSATAPATAATATIELGYFQLSDAVTGAAFYDDANLVNAGPNTGLINPGWDSYVPTPSFEPSPNFIPGWTKPGGNGFINNSFSRTGNTALIFFGNFNGLDNTTIVYQERPVTPGELVEASSFVGQLAGDALELDNVAFMNLEFRDGADALLENTRLTMLRAGGPVDVFTPGTVLATAPAGATKARIQFGFFQSSALVPGPNVQGRGAAYFDDSELSFLGPNTGLINPSFDTFFPGADFEPDPERPLPGWSTAGFNGGVSPTAPNIGQTQDSNTGEFAAFIFGQFPGDNSPNDTVVFQDQPVSAGEGVEVGMVAQHLVADPLSASSFLALNIEWLDASDQLLGFETTNALNAASPQGVYIPVTVSGNAPAGAATARIAIVYSQANESTGAALFDDVTIAFTPAPACVGDINGDGFTNAGDFVILAGNFGSSVPPNTAGDLNGDGVVNASDFVILAGDFGCAG